RPPQPLLGGEGFETWREREGADAHSFVAELRVDASGRLPAGSPAIKRGIALDAVTDDIDGRPRVAPFDVGADEWTPLSSRRPRESGDPSH
ncbi:hypothetical protein, partial [Dokdonella sp.]|uniref:hypothetical protein n=1 Tax=Dokdonella sp. TaxID=2291710 RepID=UPI00262B60C9